jgi:S1-C subfamily serine protease
MFVTVNCYLNQRIGAPDTASIIAGYLVPGSKVEIKKIVAGTEIESNNIWYQTDEGYYWSGGFAETEFEFSQTKIDSFPPFDQLEILGSAKNYFFDKISKSVEGFSGLSVSNKLDKPKSASAFHFIVQVNAGSAALALSPYPDGLKYRGINIPVNFIASSHTHASFLGDKIKREELNDWGTCGFFAKSVNSPDCYLVTNYHVLCGDFIEKKIFSITPENALNKKVVYGAEETGVLAYAKLDFFNDIALVKTTSAKSNNDNKINKIGQITGILPLMDIKKALSINDNPVVKLYGAASQGVMRGEIVSCSSSQPIFYLDGLFRQPIYDLIQATKLSTKGDSGSAVVNGANELVGILVADDDQSSYIIPIERILSNFKIMMP